ncbi:MAG TPA: LysE family translocator [Variovorax sp.]|nr:LysE family translocator [Variovorax sp.]
MNTHTLLLYAAASFVLAVTPGPTMLLALSNGISGGMQRAKWGMLGALLGSSVVIAAVALGLGSLLAASEWLFNALRVAGVIYLAWLGIKLWRSPATDVAAALAAPDNEPQGRLALTRSLTVALSNPKSVLFFAAFLPQFIDTALPQGPQYLVLGAIFIGLDACIMLAYAGAGTQAMRWMSRRSLQRLNRGCAAGMWALAATLAFWRRPGA